MKLLHYNNIYNKDNKTGEKSLYLENNIKEDDSDGNDKNLLECK